MIDLVLVDFDDTLVETASRFQLARQQLFALLGGHGFDDSEVRRIHHEEVDPVMRERFGFGPQRLAPAFAETYRHLCRLQGLSILDHVVAECRRLGEAVAGPPAPIAGALDALRMLAARYRTALYTQTGDYDYQLGCIRAAGVLEVLPAERIHILSHKTSVEFRRTLELYGIARPDRAWMVGNSMRSDINPALEVGANAILVEQTDPWEYDVVEPISPHFHQAPSFPAAARFLLNGAGAGTP